MNGPQPASRLLGYVTAGSLERGLEVTLAPETPFDDPAMVGVGYYVAIESGSLAYLGMVTDVRLASGNGIAGLPAATASPFVRKALSGAGVYGQLAVRPYVVIAARGAREAVARARTIPGHFAPVRQASRAEIAQVFGEEGDDRIYVGTPVDLEDAPICLSYDALLERSIGVFGRTGTGKSFLTRLALAELLVRGKAQERAARRAVGLIFDLHGDYGWEGQADPLSGSVKPPGLKQLFPQDVSVFALDPNAGPAKRSNAEELHIWPGEIEPEDLDASREALRLTEQAVMAAFELQRRYGARWVLRVLEEAQRDETDDGESATSPLNALAHDLNFQPGTITNLLRVLRLLSRAAYWRAERPAHGTAKDAILGRLQSGQWVIVDFNARLVPREAHYVFLANFLTRRIYDQWRRKAEEEPGDSPAYPPHLVVAVEEAHNFLSRQLAGLTAFGQIARELRKYNVTLLVIDQRPSDIDPEVMSQIATRFVLKLDNERDVEAVLEGQEDRGGLKAIVNRLNTQREAVIVGHAVPVPVVARVRMWDQAEQRKIVERRRRTVGAAGATADDLYRR